MGFLRKTIKKIGRGIKKIGKKIGKAFKSILKPFAKVFNKLGPIGSMAMMMIMPGVGQLMAGFGTTMGGTLGTAIKFVGNAINYVASAPKKIFSTITNGLGAGWDALTNASTAEGGSWFSRFGEEFTKSWNSRDVNSVFKFDYSTEGVERIANIQKGKGNILGYTPPKIDEVIPKDTTTTTTPTIADIPKPEASPGVAGKISDTFKKIGETEIPVAGKVSDIASVGSTALGTASILGQYGVIDLGGEDGIGTAGDFGYQASTLLGPTTDAGGMYNITAPTWSYDYNQSYTNNMTNAQNLWNNHYGFGQGFDPNATPGYGYGYEQWLLDSMGMGVSRGAA
tara:strand:- start:5096 stop:6112 length:1017 start_codon:yes stop_codon:yes gene_type:complete